MSAPTRPRRRRRLLLGMAAAAVGLGAWSLAASAPQDGAARDRRPRLQAPEGPIDARPASRARELTTPETRDERVGHYVVREQGPEQRRSSLAERARTRAYDGAPPPMGHSALFGAGSRHCLDCHGTGMAIGARVARPMSHPPLVSCTQCHVEPAHREFGPVRRSVENTFVGRGASPPVATELQPDAGAAPRDVEPTRAPAVPRPWAPDAGADPPEIPHSLSMRTRCLSCHGEYGYPGLRTDHPRRTHCTQCHVAQRPDVPRAR